MILSSKLSIMSKYQKTLMFLRRATLNNKVNNTVPWIYVISDLNDKESFSTFYQKRLQGTRIND